MEYVPCRSFPMQQLCILREYSRLHPIQNQRKAAFRLASHNKSTTSPAGADLLRHKVLENQVDILGAFEGHLSSSQPEGLLQRAETFLKEILRGLGDKTLKNQSFNSILLLLLLSSICKIRLEAYYDAIKGVSSLMRRFLSRFHNYLGVALGHRTICRAFFGVKICWGRVGPHPMGCFHFPCIFR